VNATPRPTLRALLRDTALQVSQISQGETVSEVAQLRERCALLVRHLDAALEARRVPQDVRDDLLMAQCGLLDECALTYLPDNLQSEWETQPLQVQRFGHHDAGVRVFNRLDMRMRELPPKIDLLECYDVILGLGFKGHYARDNDADAQRLTLIAELQHRIAQFRREPLASFSLDEATKDPFAWLRRLSPWAVAATACVSVAMVWVALDLSLNADVARLFATTAR
jgi:type VI secretion system protein ImpK